MTRRPATPRTAPTSWTVATWVRSTSLTGGRILGFGDSAAAGSTVHDRALLFSVKGADLCLLDKPNNRFVDTDPVGVEARRQWRLLGVADPRPFTDLEVFAPAEDSDPGVTPVPHIEVRDKRETSAYGWSPRTFIERGLLEGVDEVTAGVTVAPAGSTLTALDAATSTMPAVAAMTPAVPASFPMTPATPPASPPITVNLQVDGTTLATAVHRADRDTATRSFSPVPAY